MYKYICMYTMIFTVHMYVHNDLHCVMLYTLALADSYVTHANLTCHTHTHTTHTHTILPIAMSHIPIRHATQTHASRDKAERAR